LVLRLLLVVAVVLVVLAVMVRGILAEMAAVVLLHQLLVLL
jgi:hypothetical protein